MTPDALARARREAQERNAVLEKSYDTYEVPSGVPATGVSTMRDGAVVAGDALMHSGAIVPMPSCETGHRAVRIDVGPIRSVVQDSATIVSAALRRVGSDLYGSLGTACIDDAVPLAGWYDPENMRVSFIISMKEGDYQTWRLSDLPMVRSTTIAGRPIVPHDSRIYDQNTLSPILSHQLHAIEERLRRRVDPMLSTVSIVTLVMSAIQATLFGITPSTLVTAFASLLIGLLSRVGRDEKSALPMRILRANKQGVSILIAGAALLSVILPSGLAHLPMSLVVMIVLVGVSNGYESAIKEQKRSTETPAEPDEIDGAGDVDDTDTITSILEACNMLPLHKQDDARLAAETCRMIDGFDPSHPMVHEARRSIDGLSDLLSAHANAMRYARGEERATETLKLIEGLESAALAVDAARRDLLRSASQQVDTHARYLASRTPSVLDRTT